MKKTLLTLLIGVATIAAQGDTLYLNAGYTVEGTIIESKDNSRIVIRTGDGRETAYPRSDVARIERDTLAAPAKQDPAIEKPHAAKRGYHAFVETSYGILAPDHFFASLSTTHGRQLSPCFFAGGGIAVSIAVMPGKVAYTVPVYGEVRANVGERLAQFTAGTRLGLSLGSNLGVYWHVDAGLRLGFTPRLALHVAPFVELLPVIHKEYVQSRYSSLYTATQSWKLYVATGIKIGMSF